MPHTFRSLQCVNCGKAWVHEDSAGNADLTGASFDLKTSGKQVSEQVFQLLHQSIKDEPKDEDEPTDNDQEREKGRRSQRSRSRYNRRREHARSPSREEVQAVVVFKPVNPEARWVGFKDSGSNA